MNYEQYCAEDFVTDESFIAYYLQADHKTMVFWQDWIDLHPEKLAEVNQAKSLLAKLSLQLEEGELQTAFNKFDRFLEKESTISPMVIPTRRPFSYQKIAVAATLLIVSSVFAVQIYRKHLAKAASYLSYHMDYGKTGMITLSDGSKISLNSNSTLKYPEKFTGELRKVELEGEGFFEITKDKAKPFVVITKEVTTKVLGTKFNVSAYHNLPTVSVALIEGSVAVELTDQSKTMLLQPSEMVSLSRVTHQLEKSKFNKSEVLGWKTGTIIFDNATFKDIAAKFYNVYGITLLNKTGQSDWRYNARFQKTDYITLIENISFAKRINYQINGKTITLTK